AAPNVTPVRVHQVESPTLAASAGRARSVADMFRMTAAVRRARADVFFSPTIYTYFPLPPLARAVVTIHDALADRFPELTLPSRRARLFWNLKVAVGCRQARLILTVSEFAAREIAEVLRVPPSRIRVATEAPSGHYRPSESPGEIQAVAARIGLPAAARWFLYVGGLNPHKHVDALVTAHARVVREHPANPPFLVLVGPEDDVFLTNRREIDAAIAAGGAGAYIRWAGFVEDADLRHLYTGAVALVLLSACEGFGLPAVEAAACGTPVVATTASPLPQLLAGAGLFVAPADAAAAADAMTALLSDEPRRAALGRVALTRAGALTWTRCARATLAALEEAAA
ncbi:MAG: glycosyltransferase family 1 protein, partial [Acidobacteriota bacterium]